MNHNTLGRFGGWALLLLAATQGLLLGLRPWPGSVASDPWLAAGDHGLRGKEARGLGCSKPAVSGVLSLPRRGRSSARAATLFLISEVVRMPSLGRDA
jgi:hypothetical protein